MQYLELTKSEKDFTALKSQSEGLSKEYDRLLEEYTQTKVCKMEFFLLLQSFSGWIIWDWSNCISSHYTLSHRMWNNLWVLQVWICIICQLVKTALHHVEVCPKMVHPIRYSPAFRLRLPIYMHICCAVVAGENLVLPGNT